MRSGQVTVKLSSELSAQRSTDGLGPTLGAKDENIKVKIDKIDNFIRHMHKLNVAK